LRILATVERYAPAIGGAERVVQRIAEGLARRGHEVHVLTGGASAQAELNGVTVHRVAVTGNEARGMQGDTVAVLEAIAAVSPDLVFNYAAQTWATDLCFALLARRDRPRMVLAPCGFSGLGKRRYRRYFDAMPARLRSYDALILHSSVYQDWDFATAAGAQQLVVVPNGADPPVAVDSTATSASAGRSLAVTVGSHVVSKGHAQFARIVREMARTRPLTGTIVAPRRHGLDALRGCQLACQTRARAQSMQLVDGSPAGAVQSAIAAADLFLFTSQVECAPLVILEAMAAATPWVSYDVGNVSELAGGLVAANPRELRCAAEEILDGGRAELGAEGHAAWAAEHRWEAIVGQYESVFQRVLSTSVRAPATR
jgi:glycosyltransferase involved in cell wall biosynthesis